MTRATATRLVASLQVNGYNAHTRMVTGTPITAVDPDIEYEVVVTRGRPA